MGLHFKDPLKATAGKNASTNRARGSSNIAQILSASLVTSSFPGSVQSAGVYLKNPKWSGTKLFEGLCSPKWTHPRPAIDFRGLTLWPTTSRNKMGRYHGEGLFTGDPISLEPSFVKTLPISLLGNLHANLEDFVKPFLNDFILTLKGFHWCVCHTLFIATYCGCKSYFGKL